MKFSTRASVCCRSTTDFIFVRSRLYRRRFLRPNTHFSAFFKIYKIDIPLHRSEFNIVQNFDDLCKNSQHLGDVSKFCWKLTQICSFSIKISRNFSGISANCRWFPEIHRFCWNFGKMSRKLLTICDSVAPTTDRAPTHFRLWATTDSGPCR